MALLNYYLTIVFAFIFSWAFIGTSAPLRLLSHGKYDLDNVVPFVLVPNFHQPQNSGTIFLLGELRRIVVVND